MSGGVNYEDTWKGEVELLGLVELLAAGQEGLGLEVGGADLLGDTTGLSCDGRSELRKELGEERSDEQKVVSRKNTR